MSIQYPSIIYSTLLGPKSDFAGESPLLWATLANTLEKARKSASKIASAIRVENPWVTDHSVDHLDALWQIVDLLIEPSDINICEAFFLGMTFMFHDLGNTSLAHKSKSPQDTHLYKAFLRQLQRSSPGVPISDLQKQANFHYLRSTHARNVDDIAVRDLATPSQSSFFLIDDESLRTALGTWIGYVCRSHNDDIASVIKEFKTIGVVSPPAEFPQHLKVNLLKMACLLRMCDAAHVDYRRASKIERLLRGDMPSTSENHWRFQEKLSVPLLEESQSLIKYTSHHPFAVSESESWWTCYDYLKMVDSELRTGHEALRNHTEVKAKASGVHGAGSPSQLSATIQCSGWVPAEIRINAANPGMLVDALAGGMLYGRNPEVAVRELVQNSRDAIAAYRVIADQPESWGEIRLEATRSNDGSLRNIAFIDNGLGMTLNTVQSFLLTLGRSLWNDIALATMSPELASSEFKAVGRFGIGWFSVFLLSQNVRISTRHFQASPSETIVISLADGVKSRPVLLKPNSETQLQSPGTRIEALGIA